MTQWTSKLAWIAIFNFVRDHETIPTSVHNFSKCHSSFVESISLRRFHDAAGTVLFVHGNAVSAVVVQSAVRTDAAVVSTEGIALLLSFQPTFRDEGRQVDLGLAVIISQRSLRETMTTLANMFIPNKREYKLLCLIFWPTKSRVSKQPSWATFNYTAIR